MIRNLENCTTKQIKTVFKKLTSDESKHPFVREVLLQEIKKLQALEGDKR